MQSECLMQNGLQIVVAMIIYLYFSFYSVHRLEFGLQRSEDYVKKLVRVLVTWSEIP